MSNIITFPVKAKTIRETIKEGFLTAEVRVHIRGELDKMSHRSAEAWDVRFTTDMLSFREKLSSSQQEQLLRILQDPIIGEEYPDGLIL